MNSEKRAKADLLLQKIKQKQFEANILFVTYDYGRLNETLKDISNYCRRISEEFDEQELQEKKKRRFRNRDRNRI